MKILAIYDNEGESVDRYTVVTDQPHSHDFLSMLSLSEGGTEYSEWGGGQYESNKPNAHLGKLIHFEALTEDTQKHIATRVFGDN